MHDFRWPALITLAVQVLLIVVAWRVVQARVKYKIIAPAMTGHPAFERAVRVQMNTIENVLMFLPALWLFAAFVSGIWSALLGAVWLAARAWYVLAYQRAANKRAPPYGLSMLVIAILTLGSAWGVLHGFI